MKLKSFSRQRHGSFRGWIDSSSCQDKWPTVTGHLEMCSSILPASRWVSSASSILRQCPGIRFIWMSQIPAPHCSCGRGWIGSMSELPTFWIPTNDLQVCISSRKTSALRCWLTGCATIGIGETGCSTESSAGKCRNDSACESLPYSHTYRGEQQARSRGKRQTPAGIVPRLFIQKPRTYLPTEVQVYPRRSPS